MVNQLNLFKVMAASVAVFQSSAARGLTSEAFSLPSATPSVSSCVAKKSAVAASLHVPGGGKHGFGGRSLQKTFVPRVPVASRKSHAVCAVAGVKDISEAEFEDEVLKSDLPVLVDFWATWCGPCKLIAPLMGWVANEYAGKLKVVKVETDPNPSLVEKYKVYGLPTLIVFHKGAPVPGSHSEGAITKDKLKKFVEKSLPELAAK
eukprot:jgi/Mesvir1/22504/Mv18535-RA.1